MRQRINPFSYVVDKLKYLNLGEVNTYRIASTEGSNVYFVIEFSLLTLQIKSRLKQEFVNADCYLSYNACILDLNEQ